MYKHPNILFLLHSPPPIHGSSIVGKAIMDSNLINENFDCRYINLLVSHTLEETGKASLLKIIRFLGVYWNLLLAILKKKPDACYLAITATGAAFLKDVLLVTLLKGLGVKMVYHMHNKGVSELQVNKVYYRLYRYVFKNSYVILLSKLLYYDIQKFVPESRVYICPNGIASLNSYNKSSPSKPGEQVTILFLSNLFESKGVFVLLEACSILQKKGLFFQCIFIGGEGNVTSSQFNEKVNQMGLSHHVKYVGNKFGEDKKQALMDADIFAFPTFYNYECSPLVLMEAMSFCLPVVSTSEGGIPDLVDDRGTGFLVLQKNVEVLAAKLELLIKEPGLRRQMGEAGRRKYEQEFTLDKFEHRLTEILHQISE